ncbi:hypothetical protein ACOTVS_09940 [Aliarcobacter butzleri]|uniref:hypothetical protein n=1 Tax=Aliarcobacter butzleri TaxID=28197 RepID=UPI00344B74A7
MPKRTGLRIVKKEIKKDYEINYRTAFSKDEKRIIKAYIETVLQTDYSGKCLNVEKDKNKILFYGVSKKLISEVYLSEIKISCSDL